MTASASVPGIPDPGLSCSVNVLGVDSAQRIVDRTYTSENGQGNLYTSVWEQSRLGFVPRALVKKESAGAESPDALGSTGRDYYATAADGSLYVLGLNLDGTLTKKKVGTTWSSVRLMTAVPALAGRPGSYVYSLTDDGRIFRYNTATKAESMHSTTLVGASGWQGVKTLTWYGLKTLPDGQSADVLLATLTTGQLVEYTIPHKTPTKWTRKDVRPTSWGSLTAITVGSCAKNGTMGPNSAWIGTLPTGDAYLYMDKNQETPDSADILAYGRLAAGWPERIFAG
ncbi:hypothetical protein OOK13_41970 [Streptomyces sp. NBC_00378]|uniref:hypothetical protein n=1 Tax=unclassified Streptomyces TaxID=2593676 RepID=UPI002256042C|nr:MULTISPECIES: hypothetical protein [unclassified Streptomyces]MCX5114900.1 hypothetical protein [Streptomyces sp. NBC_00378]